MRPLAPLLALLAAFAGCVEPVTHAHHDEPADAPATTPSPRDASSPYAGQEAREIKALSPEDIAGYKRGAGLGYAKPAELNSYPGPLHVLELQDEIGLTTEQADAIEAIRQEMLGKVVPLGEAFLVVEGEIEQGFRDGTLDEESLRAMLDESARLEAALRHAHLDAHLETRALMTLHQVKLYDSLRGYDAGQGHAHGGGHGGHG